MFNELMILGLIVLLIVENVVDTKIIKDDLDLYSYLIASAIIVVHLVNL